MTPGISPLLANVLKQIRHISNLRRYPLDRPHTLHLVYRRTLNAGFFFCFTLHASVIYLNSP